MTTRTSIVRTIRGELPPAAGVRWLLDGDHSDGTLATSHPILGVRHYPLKATGGTLAACADAQFELTLALRCAHSDGSVVERGVQFRSTSLSRPDTFRYLAKGDLSVGSVSGIAVIRMHDLSWIARRNPGADTRIITMSAAVDRIFWGGLANIGEPWLVRNEAELFLHSEWTLDTVMEAA